MMRLQIFLFHALGIPRECGEIAVCKANLEPKFRGILAATILASSLAFIDASIVNIILPKIQSQFRKDLTTAQWVIQFYGLILSTLLLPNCLRKNVTETRCAIMV